MAKPVVEPTDAAAAPTAADVGHGPGIEDRIPSDQWQEATKQVKEALRVTDTDEEPKLEGVADKAAWIAWVVNATGCTMAAIDKAVKENKIINKDRTKIGKVTKLLEFCVGV